MLNFIVVALALAQAPERQAVSLLGKDLYSPAISEAARPRLEENLKKAKADYDADPASADAIIWYGRRLAYLNRYREAIAVFTEGIKKHPNDARMYRHRGHRYITVREFDNAIRDLEQAAKLVQGKPDQIEPDGAPNKYNIPVGTLHHNIFYHLALAHYLKHDFKAALPVWQKTVAISTNDDAVVSGSDWLYMTLRRLGRDADAKKVLEPIKKDMKILENDAYHRRLLMYKGELPVDSLLGAGEDPIQIVTYGYGVGNWYLVNGQRDQAFGVFRRMLDQPQWSAFGYVAAEKELAVSTQRGPVEQAWQYRKAHEAEIVKDFAELLAIPNVAADSENIRRNARYIADKFTALGAKMEVWQRPGAPPLIYGELKVPGAKRTIGMYAHYDGQPVNPKEWRDAPWQPALYLGKNKIPFPKPGESVNPETYIYARSAGDDKAPIMALLSVLRAGVKPTNNIKFLFDGEEEAGSPNLDAYVEQHRAQLDDIDGWLFFDGPVHQSRRPQIAFGGRGLAGFEITTYGAARGLHSGHYGNWAPNPALELAQLLASMKDKDGRVLIDGFYDSVQPMGAEERAALDALPDYDPQLKRELGLAHTDGAGKKLPETLLVPSLNIRGISSGAVGAQANNVIPASATASMDIRLVKGNDPKKMIELVEAWMQKQGYFIVRTDPDLETRLAHPRIAKITSNWGEPASQTAMGLPFSKEVVAAARSVAGDQLILLPTLGGTLPLTIFTEVLKKPAIIVPIANHDDNQHTSDENLRIANLWYGIELYAALLGLRTEN